MKREHSESSKEKNPQKKNVHKDRKQGLKKSLIAKDKGMQYERIN